MFTVARLYMLAAVLFLTFIVFVIACSPSGNAKIGEVEDEPDTVEVFQIPDTADIPDDEFGKLVRYGRDLIVNTAYYIGPDGKVGKHLGNKMNCTNCHLDAGTRPYGLNYLSTHGRYPQFRGRENRILSLAERVNNCIERSHNGKAMLIDSREMNAIECYIKWLGKGVPVGQRVEGDNGIAIRLPDYHLDVKHGKEVYQNECMRCHGENGEGKMLPGGVTYEYPPLWGKQAYQPGAGMYRIITAARFIKANMPHDQATWQKPKLSDRDALDVAAFINDPSYDRPPRKGNDYPDLGRKPIDYPFGPYNDHFSEDQHKYGPYQPIIDYRQKKGLYVSY